MPPGSTGAALAAGLLTVKRMPGVHRPGLAVLLPVPGRPVLLLDVGATVEVREVDAWEAPASIAVCVCAAR